MMTPDATVSLVALNRHGPMAADGASYLRELARAFPDLMVRMRRLFVTADNTAVAEITIDGTMSRAWSSCARRAPASATCRSRCGAASGCCTAKAGYAPSAR